MQHILMYMKTSRTKIKICDDCQGKGHKWFQKFPPRHGSDQGEGSYVKCETCKGSGMIKVMKNISITITPYNPNTHG